MIFAWQKVGQSFVQPTPSGKEELGKIEVAAEVIEIVAGIAVSEVEGIAATRGNIATGVVERFGKKYTIRALNQGSQKVVKLPLMYFAL